MQKTKNRNLTPTLLAAASLALAASSISFATTGAKFAEPDNSTPAVHPTRGVTLVIDEDFADITTLPGAGWSQQNLSNPLGTTDWFQGNDAVFPAQAGAPTAYIGANFNNTTGGTGTISNWLLTPEVNFGTGAELRFFTRVGAGSSTFPDRLEVRVSSAGASTDVGASESSVGDFSTVLLTINPSLDATAGTCPPGTGGYPEDWCEIVVTSAEGLPSTGSGRIGFRYFVTGAGPSGDNSNYIGIDTVSFDEGTLGAPPPATQAVPVNSPWALALLALILASLGFVAVRRLS